MAEQTRCKNRIRATLTLQGRKLPSGKTGWSAAAREKLAAETRPLAECEPAELWRGLLRTELEHLEQVRALVATVTAKLDALAQGDPGVARLQTIRGVGPRTAEVLVTVLDQPRRFATRRQVSAYVGLVPRRYQSGQMDRSGRITKRGSPLLRQVLNQAAWAAVRCNPELRAFYLRLGGAEETTQGGHCGRDAEIVGHRLGAVARWHDVPGPAVAAEERAGRRVKNTGALPPDPRLLPLRSARAALADRRAPVGWSRGRLWEYGSGC